MTDELKKTVQELARARAHVMEAQEHVRNACSWEMMPAGSELFWERMFNLMLEGLAGESAEALIKHS